MLPGMNYLGRPSPAARWPKQRQAIEDGSSKWRITSGTAGPLPQSSRKTDCRSACEQWHCSFDAECAEPSRIAGMIDDLICRSIRWLRDFSDGPILGRLECMRSEQTLANRDVRPQTHHQALAISPMKPHSSAFTAAHFRKRRFT